MRNAAERERLNGDAHVSRACVHDLFAAQVERTPDGIALVGDGQQLTYRELDNQSNQVSHHLRARGIGRESLVGIAMERTPQAIIAILGVLKAGGAYVPLDIRSPEERLSLIIKDSGVEVVVTETRIVSRLAVPRERTLLFDDEWPAISRHETSAPDAGVRPENLAYVIYTSGSTGIPKGVMIEHAALVAFLESTNPLYHMRPSDRALQFASFSFDVSVEEIFLTLAFGGTLMLRTEEMVSSISRFLAQCDAWGLTYLHLPTAYWHELVASLADGHGRMPSSVRMVVISGEKALPERMAQWHALGIDSIRMINSYGPTETTVDVLNWELPSSREPLPFTTAVPIGKPLARVTAYVLDANRKRVAPGSVGELCIGGAQLARGYLNKPDLTAERFIQYTGGAAPGERLYRTGDMVRELPDGNIEYLGRVDDQVKIRGYRIELGDIEASIGSFPGVHQAVVVAREDEPGVLRLVAYIVPRAGEALSLAALRTRLQQCLPDYMIPAAFVRMNQFTLTHAGKIDKKNLPVPDRTRPELSAEFVAPRNEYETVIASWWCEILDLDSVGVDDSFFELGGHSLLVGQLIGRVYQSYHSNLPFRLIFEHPTVSAIAAYIERQPRGTGAVARPTITPAKRGGAFPLSFSQEAVWFFLQLQPEMTAYTSPSIIRFKGTLNIAALEKAITELIARHEIYRTTFHAADGKPVQVIHPPVPYALRVVEVGDRNTRDHAAEADRLVREEVRKPFDLEHYPLLRFTLFRVHPEEFLLTVVEHHFVHDGWSFNVMAGELRDLYAAFNDGRTSPLPALPVQFVDYVVWERAWVESDEARRQIAYWRSKLAGLPPLLPLPVDHPRPAVQKFVGEAIRLEFDGEFCESLRAFSRSREVSLYMTMLGGFITLLHRYSGTGDVCVGSGVANRTTPEAELLIGMIVNTVALRVDLTDDPTVRQMLDRIRESCLEAYANQNVPFEKVVEAIRPARNLGYSPVYQVLFGFHDSPLKELDFPGLETEVDNTLENGSSKTDLNVIIIPRSEQHIRNRTETRDRSILIKWEYDSNLFDKSTMTQMFDDYRAILAGMMNDVDARVSALELLDSRERRLIENEWNTLLMPENTPRCVHRQFEEQVLRTPDAVALVCGKNTLTYRMLNDRSNRFAQRLKALGLAKGSIVGVLLERSSDVVAALFGVLKAGGTYLPLDPGYPPERLSFMLQDARVSAIIVDDASHPLSGDHRSIVVSHSLPNDDHRVMDVKPDIDLEGSDPAYVIYTSGSTGSPKGVVVSHEAIARHVHACIEAYDVSAKDRILQFASASFDASLEQILPALLCGATLVMRGREVWSVDEFINLLHEQSLTIVNLPTGYWHEVVEYLCRTSSAAVAPRLMIVGGEEMKAGSLQLWRTSPWRNVKLLNAYGPTETTITALLHDCSTGVDVRTSTGSVPIGRPLGPRITRILDPHGFQVPAGVHGELCLGGPCLAIGYLNRPDITRGKFITDPTVEGGRLYRTGDRARYLPDGTIEFLGRVDHQVKIRGFRVELGEIENAIRRHPSVSQVVVVADTHASSGSRIIAYVVGKSGAVDTIALKRFLKDWFPEYMLPAAIVSLDALPLGQNGKIERRLLPSLESVMNDRENAAVEIPASPMEEALASLWSTILGVQRVGVEENFFDLGGHSLLAMQLLSRVRSAWNVDLTLADLFRFPTVRGLAGIAEDRLVHDMQNVQPDNDARKATRTENWGKH